MGPTELPMRVMLYKVCGCYVLETGVTTRTTRILGGLAQLTPKAAAIANTILQVVKESTVVITQLLQETEEVADAIMNGIVSSKAIALSKQYKEVQSFSISGSKKCALYMHNKSLIEVAGSDLLHKLYSLVPMLKQDVLVNYPLLYISDNPKSSNDVLVGSKDSWSPLHQDLPLFCTSAILVLEGHKEFVVVREDVAPSLRVNLSSGCWNKPITYEAQTYPNLQSLVEATNGAVITLRAGDMMLMPPRVFHLARNCAPTVSCNFSICNMDNIPLTVAQTFVRIEQCPRDVMHFDSDFAQLLAHCTQALLQQATVRSSCVDNATHRKRLPRVQSILQNSVRLMEWYMTLQCIPRGWVEGFWGELRNRLLDQLHSALPLHTRSDDPAGTSRPEKDAAAAGSEPAEPAPGSANAGAVGRGVTAAAAGPGKGNLPAPLRVLSRSKMTRQNVATTAPQQAHGGQGRTNKQVAALRRCTRSDSAALAAAADAAPVANDGRGDDGAPMPRKRMKLLDGPRAPKAVIE